MTSVSLVNSDAIRDGKGRFIKEHRASPETEFKKGEHWRNPKLHWSYSWLYTAYIIRGLSAAEIAKECDCTENNILYWLDKHDIPRRTISEARELKHWGLSGKKNGMFGVTGDSNPNWKGGVTPDRQYFYSSIKWKKAVRLVWKRDKATCQRCNKVTGSKGGKNWHIHHIVSFAVEELRTDIDNLILLCRPCHHWVHSKENKDNDFC